MRKHLRFLAIYLLALTSANVAMATTHYWIGGLGSNSTDFRSKTFWSLTPGGTAEGTSSSITLDANSTLIFDGSNLGGSLTGASGIINATFTGTHNTAQLKIINGANVVFQRVSGGAKLTISGDGTADPDFVIDSTATYGASRLSLRTPGSGITGTVGILLGTSTASATGSIGGMLSILDGGSNNFVAAYSSNTLFFLSGSTCVVNIGSTQYPFSSGSSTNFTSDKSVIFQSGSSYYHFGGGSPYSSGSACSNGCGSTDPIYPVDLQPGSNFYFAAANAGANGRFFNGRTLPNVYINNGISATVDGNGTITGKLSIGTGSTLIMNGKTITLTSSATGTASVAAVGGTIDYTAGGQFTVQRYVPGGQRAFRFFSHPFNTSLDLTSLTDDIIVTGGGGVAPFTASGSNNPSAFWYDPTAGNESTVSDPGWTAFATADGSGTGDTWNQYKGIRVLVRGSISDGLSPATPSPVTIDISGQINTGTQNIPVVKATNSGFNFIGNPFPSAINLTTAGGNVTLGSNINNTFWVWDMTLGTKGGWDNRSFSSSYVLPSMSAFFVKTTANDNIAITENAKTTNAATGSLFRTGNTQTQQITLQVNSGNTRWDKFELYFDEKATAGEDKWDGVKMMNSEVNFFSRTKAEQSLSIDSRPLQEEEIIPLTFNTSLQQDFTISVPQYHLANGTTLYLHDKLLDIMTPLSEGATYTFSVTSNAATQGKDRFELVTGKTVKPIELNTPATVKLFPNPASSKVLISYPSATTTVTIKLYNTVGQAVKTVRANNVNGQVSLDVKGLAKGHYLVTIADGISQATTSLLID